jgi:lysine 2,3-aminomutase
MVTSQNWTSEFKEAFRNLKDLYRFLNWPVTDELSAVVKTYPVFVPRRLAERMKVEGPGGILAKEFLPHELEMDQDLNEKGFEDPIGDKTYLKAPQLIHRYKSRALFAPTTVCPVHCRYCFRKNELYQNDEIFQQDFVETLNYLKSHPEISEIIFTGGDPLTLSNDRLEKYLKAFSEISSIKDIRFHTRYPVILPERIDNEFLSIMLEANNRFRTLSIAIHCNHAVEIDEVAIIAIKKLSGTGIQLLSQTVLLKGVNDSQNDLLELINVFLELNIRPYYLHHPDRVKGGMHFYLPLSKGRELYHGLRTSLPGWAIPQYVIDIPGGHGKVSAFNPESTAYSGKLIGQDGTVVTIAEPDLFT